MRIIIVRHGDPDYENNTVTEKGWREAELLSRALVKVKADEYLCSPLGRALDTAKLTLEKLGKEAEICGWLREFDAKMPHPDTGEEKSVAWDLMPRHWMDDGRFFHPELWRETGYAKSGDLVEKYDAVIKGLDEVMARHGYIRSGTYYRTKQGNEDCVVMFCHFGVESVMLSHLLNISPFILWHGTTALTSSITGIVTEEREKGIVSFRMFTFGSLHHLYAEGEPASFSARFCEVFENEHERH